MSNFLATVALVPLALYLLAVRHVPEGQAWTVHRGGHYLRTLQAGRHLIWPWLDHIARKVPLTGHHLEVPTAAWAGTPASADLYIQILDPLRSGDDLEMLEELVSRQADDALTCVADVLPTASEAVPALADALKAELNRRLDDKGLRVVRCALHAA